MNISNIFLWVFVIVVGLEMGAGLYETLVVLPLWANRASESVVAYYQHNAANPQFALNAGGRFWMFLTPVVGLTAIAAFVTALQTPADHRKWRMAGALLAILVVTVTFAWFVPNLLRLMYHIPEMTDVEIATTANRWVTMNWGRVAVGFAAWLCGLKAFSIPVK